MTGFSDVMGSWKIIPMRFPRNGFISVRESGAKSTPSKTILPPVICAGGCGKSPITESAVMDLPQPDSPTTASVSPRLMLKERSSKAGSLPSSVDNVTLRCSTLRRTSLLHCSSRCLRAVSWASLRSSRLQNSAMFFVFPMFSSLRAHLWIKSVAQGVTE